MTRRIFGWDLPPGVTQRMIDEAAGHDGAPCECCGLDPAECICPECPVCHETGRPNCYSARHVTDNHGLEFNREQLMGQTRLRIEDLKQQLADAEYSLQWMEEHPEEPEEDVT